MIWQNIFNLEKLIIWFFTSGIKVLAILAATWLVGRFVKIFFMRFVRRAVRKALDLGKRPTKIEEERVKTVAKVFVSVIKVALWLLALITILPEFGVNIAPLLAGLGFGGLALGLGARTIIQDYISGLFILLEDHYRVGDIVELSGKKGKVVDFNLRRTVLKSDEEVFEYIPNSQVRQATNFSRKRK